MNIDELIKNRDSLELIRVRLQDCIAYTWGDNPKEHDLQKIAKSILKNGYVDPGKYDSSLNAGQGGIIFGNGRIEALVWLHNQGVKPPRGIEVNENGDWMVPVLVGVDAESEDAAISFALDHNMLTVMGGDGVTHLEASRMYDQQAYLDLMATVALENSVVADDEDLAVLEEVLRRQREEPLSFEDDEPQHPPQESFSVTIAFDNQLDKQEFLELLKQHAEAEAISNRGQLLLHLLS